MSCKTRCDIQFNMGPICFVIRIRLRGHGGRSASCKTRYRLFKAWTELYNGTIEAIAKSKDIAWSIFLKQFCFSLHPSPPLYIKILEME